MKAIYQSPPTTMTTTVVKCTCKSTLECTCGTDNEKQFYRNVLYSLQKWDIPFLLGGTQAYEVYTGVIRSTKDLDIFVMEKDCEMIMKCMSQHGFETELIFPHWLGKIYQGDYFIDVIFSSGNGVARVDQKWFEHSVPSVAFGLNVRITPVEEMIWSKGFIMEKERFDGGDINHLIKKCGRNRIDWRRLLDRFGSHWRVLYSHLVMFGFVYPDEQSSIVPQWLMEDLCDRVKKESSSSSSSSSSRKSCHDEDDNKLICQGPLVSRAQYLTDVHKWKYVDGRLGCMSQDDIQQWTLAIPDLEKYDLNKDDIAPGSFA